MKGLTVSYYESTCEALGKSSDFFYIKLAMWQEQYGCSRWLVLKWPKEHKCFTLPAETSFLANSTLVSTKGTTQCSLPFTEQQFVFFKNL